MIVCIVVTTLYPISVRDNTGQTGLEGKDRKRGIQVHLVLHGKSLGLSPELAGAYAHAHHISPNHEIMKSQICDEPRRAGAQCQSTEP
jgi:hypothetical protein